VSNVSVTDETGVVASLPNGSLSWTVTAGVIVAPALALVGSWTNATRFAAAGLIVNALLMALVSNPLDAVRFFDPERLMLRSLNVDTPEAFEFCVNVPLSVPVPVLSVIVTGIPAVVIAFENASRITVVTAGATATPAVATVGCWDEKYPRRDVRPYNDAAGRCSGKRGTARKLDGDRLRHVVGEIGKSCKTADHVHRHLALQCSGPCHARGRHGPGECVTRFPPASSTRITGCVENTIPAVSVGRGLCQDRQFGGRRRGVRHMKEGGNSGTGDLCSIHVSCLTSHLP